MSRTESKALLNSFFRNFKTITAEEKELLKKFIFPNNFIIPEFQDDLYRQVDEFFRAGERFVLFAKTLRNCEIKGTKLSPGGVRLVGMPPLSIKKNRHLLITIDNHPDMRDRNRVSLLSEKKGDIVYELTKVQLDFLLTVIKPLGDEWKRANQLQSTLRRRASMRAKKKLPS